MAAAPLASNAGSTSTVQTHLDFAPDTGLKEAKSHFEREFILKKLKENDWNISKTAQAIGIERAHLHRKIKAFKITEAKEN